MAHKILEYKKRRFLSVFKRVCASAQMDVLKEVILILLLADNGIWNRAAEIIL